VGPICTRVQKVPALRANGGTRLLCTYRYCVILPARFQYIALTDVIQPKYWQHALFWHATTNQVSDSVPYFEHPTTNFQDLHPHGGGSITFFSFLKIK
jgi:hypothetical protein